MRRLISSLALLLLPATAALAQVTELPEARDFPGIPRYEGSILFGYDVTSYDEVDVAIGPFIHDGQGQNTATRFEPAAGRLTRLLYLEPEERSPLEIFRNYEAALTDAGFDIDYSCTDPKCGDASMPNVLYYERRFENSDAAAYAFNVTEDEAYLVARKAAADLGEGQVRDLTVTLYVARETGAPIDETDGRVMALMTVIEAEPMATNMVFVAADEMSREIGAEGHVALYGILFDFDSATLQPESAPTLEQIALLLQGDPALSLYVVGHTDNAGSYDYNLDLSRRRAEAVVGALAASHGVAAARLRAIGVGLVAPVATNETEAGRTLNRRVELVRQ